MSAKQKDLVIGGEPRIDFLPPEIKQKKDDRRRIRGLVFFVVLVLAVCLLAYAGVTTVSIASQSRLEAEQNRTLELISQQGQYSEARSVSATLDTAKAARLVASAPEIAWSPYLSALQASMPEGAVVTQILVESGSTTTEGPTGVGPLAPVQVARVTLFTYFPTLADIAAWQDASESTLGHAWVWSSPVTSEGEGYAVQGVLDINSNAYAMRFFETKTADEDTAAANDEVGSD